MNGIRKTSVRANLEVDVRITSIEIRQQNFPFQLGCFACFCCCCMGCKLAKHLGEATIIGCLPCSIPYLRTKIRVARRIKVSCSVIGSVHCLLGYSQGSCIGDCCASECCLPCVTTQIAAELESQGMWDPPKAVKTKQPANERTRPYNERH